LIFGFGPQELLVILIIVLCIYGRKRLPQIGKSIGKSVKEFKKAKNMYNEDPVEKWIKGEEEEKTPGEMNPKKTENPVTNEKNSATSAHSSLRQKEAIDETIQKLK
jgi:TatA/E family protein of Tat protein translocase